MSDSLDKLLVVEKVATALVADAEQEAGKRKSQAQRDAQALFSEKTRTMMDDTKRFLQASAEQMRAEREEKNRAYRETLSGGVLDVAKFTRVIWEFLGASGR